MSVKERDDHDATHERERPLAPLYISHLIACRLPSFLLPRSRTNSIIKKNIKTRYSSLLIIHIINQKNNKGEESEEEDGDEEG